MAPQSATGSIVVGTDGSETAKLAVREAVRLAKAFGEEVHVVSGYTPLRGARIAGAPEGAAKVWAPLPDSEVSAILDEAAAEVRLADVQVHTHAVPTDAADALLQVASDTGANLDRGRKSRHAGSEAPAGERPQQGLAPGTLQRLDRRNRRVLRLRPRAGTSLAGVARRFCTVGPCCRSPSSLGVCIRCRCRR